METIDIDSDEVLLNILAGTVETWAVSDTKSYRTGQRLCLCEPWALISLDAGYEYNGPIPNMAERSKFELAYRAGASDFIESLISEWREPTTAPEWACRMNIEVIAIGDKCLAVIRK
jgi:hypothetical protein